MLQRPGPRSGMARYGIDGRAVRLSLVYGRFGRRAGLNQLLAGGLKSLNLPVRDDDAQKTREPVLPAY